MDKNSDNSVDTGECQHISYHLPKWNKNGKVIWDDIKTQHKSLNAEAHCIKPPTKVVPVIFIPGIMGTNLMDNDEENVWKANAFMGADTLKFVGMTGSERRKSLDAKNTKVDSSGEIMPSTYALFSDDGKMLPTRQKRGWGEALYLSYGSFLEVLQSALMDDWQKDVLNIVQNDDAKALQTYFNSTGILSQLVEAKIGDSNEEKLTEDELNHFKHFLFSVHVFGYNWLDDNANSAKNLVEYIDDIIDKTYQEHGYGLAIEKVILVTHSMGGLVARYAMNPPEETTFKGCQDKVLGVVHGVIPDLGSPAAYRRMKTGAGQEGLPGKVLGATAEELMPVLAFAPAPLQLLPYPKYQSPWLEIESAYSDNDLFLPKNKDPFSEIYLRRDTWWRLYESDILDKDIVTSENNWLAYDDIINDVVKKFMCHQEKGQYHPNTYVFYGTEVKSDTKLTWKSVSLSGMYSPSGINRMPHNHKRYFDETTLMEARLDSSGSPGDGTVPVESLSAIKKSSATKSWLATDVDHQDAYAVSNLNDIKNRPAIQFTLRAIIKMVQEVDIGAAD
ncbi:lipase family alpha/beta hydrolase [Providencia burhodogranariea]|uniref:PGAP1-like protein n=1 Tax=Providencia burhodogranariea DSM 19968 TaxID=1141662 RepID=K8WV07_9GAMM|nr:hypothetical protein [Providencia burhodogranariea]EKT64474.1 hypothetical protein OOA_02757 [Providencia burhodogranariea DSM 19968]